MLLIPGLIQEGKKASKLGRGMFNHNRVQENNALAAFSRLQFVITKLKPIIRTNLKQLWLVSAMIADYYLPSFSRKILACPARRYLKMATMATKRSIIFCSFFCFHDHWNTERYSCIVIYCYGSDVIFAFWAFTIEKLTNNSHLFSSK